MAKSCYRLKNIDLINLVDILPTIIESTGNKIQSLDGYVLSSLKGATTKRKFTYVFHKVKC